MKKYFRFAEALSHWTDFAKKAYVSREAYQSGKVQSRSKLTHRGNMGGGGSLHSKSKALEPRRLNLEQLEERQLLAVTAAEYDAIREMYTGLNLAESSDNLNLIEINANKLTSESLWQAIDAASKSEADDLVVIRTSDLYNTMALGDGTMEINLDSAHYGSLSIVGYGSQMLQITGVEAPLLTISGGTVNIGGLTFLGLTTDGSISTSDLVTVSDTASLTTSRVLYMTQFGENLDAMTPSNIIKTGSYSLAEDMVNPAICSVEFQVDGSTWAYMTGINAQDSSDYQTAIYGAQYPNTVVWYDANKTWDKEDDLLCWAASASDMLYYTGWANPTVDDSFTHEQKVFEYFKDHFTDDGSIASFGSEWFLTGDYQPQGVPGWSQLTKAGGGFYADLVTSIDDYLDYYYYGYQGDQLMVLMEAALKAYRGVGLSIAIPDVGMGHAITCWGYLYDTEMDSSTPEYYTGLILTDSDDDEYTVFNADMAWSAEDNYYQLTGYLTGAYYLSAFTALDRYVKQSIAAPTMESAWALDDESIQVEFAPVAGATSYTIQWATSSDFAEPLSEIVESAGLFTINGLRPNTEYFVRVQVNANDVYNASGWSDVISAATLSNILPLPEDALFRVTDGNDENNQFYYSGSQSCWNCGAGENQLGIFSESFTVLQTEDGTAQIAFTAQNEWAETEAHFKYLAVGENASDYWTISGDTAIWDAKDSTSPKREFTFVAWNDLNDNDLVDSGEDNFSFTVSIQWANISICVDQPFPGSDQVYYFSYNSRGEVTEYNAGHGFWDNRATEALLGSGIVNAGLVRYANISEGYGSTEWGPEAIEQLINTGNFICPGRTHLSPNGDKSLARWSNVDAYKTFTIASLSDYLNLLQYNKEIYENPPEYVQVQTDTQNEMQCMVAALGALKAAGFTVESYPQDDLDPTGWGRSDAAEIIGYIEANKDAFDINDDGVTDAADATLFKRYAYGKRGESLINGIALGPDRETAEKIEEYIQGKIEDGTFDINLTLDVDNAQIIETFLAYRTTDILFEGYSKEGWTRTTPNQFYTYFDQLMTDGKFDANGDFKADETDAILYTRYLAGLRGDDLIAGFDDRTGWTRTAGDDIVEFIEERFEEKDADDHYIYDINGDGLFDDVDVDLMTRIMKFYTGETFMDGHDVSPWSRTGSYLIWHLNDLYNDKTLDIDGDGKMTMEVDAELISRYAEGLRGDALIDGLTLEGMFTTAAEIEAQICLVIADGALNINGTIDPDNATLLANDLANATAANLFSSQPTGLYDFEYQWTIETAGLPGTTDSFVYSGTSPAHVGQDLFRDGGSYTFGKDESGEKNEPFNGHNLDDQNYPQPKDNGSYSVGDMRAFLEGLKSRSASSVTEAERAALEKYVLQLSSYSEGSYVIYLNFEGDDSDKNMLNGYVPRYTIDGDQTRDYFTFEELIVMYESWVAASEDFAPFNVNVTLNKSVYENATNKLQGLIGGTVDDWYGSGALEKPAGGVSGGVAGGSFYVFAQGSRNGAGIGNTVSHEAGHNFGLMHQSQPGIEYYGGNSQWSAIMGSGSSSLTQWSKGEFPNACIGANGTVGETQDDISILVRSAGLRPDQNNIDIYTATYMDMSKVTSTTKEVSLAEGIIGGYWETAAYEKTIFEDNEDADYFMFEIAENEAYHFNIGGIAIDGITNLDARANIYNAAGELLHTYNSDDALNIEFTFGGQAGVYYISVFGTGKDTETAGIYSDYGSLGMYDIRVKKGTALRVNTTSDIVNANDNYLSLREAVARVNAMSNAEAAFIYFENAGTYNLDSELVLTHSVGFTSEGKSVAFSATGTNRVMTIGQNNASNTINVTFDGINIRNGSTDFGGGLYINNNANVVFANGTLSGNTATTAGGAVYVNGGSFAIFGGSVSYNNANEAGAGVYVASGNFTVNDTSNSEFYDVSAKTTFSGNSIVNADYELNEFNYLRYQNSFGNARGGAVHVSSGSSSINAATFSSNRVSGWFSQGAGLYVDTATVTVSNSTFQYNSSLGDTASSYDVSGAGIYVNFEGTVTLNDSTIYNNTASSTAGGVVSVEDAGGAGLYADGMLTVNNSTISYNSIVINSQVGPRTGGNGLGPRMGGAGIGGLSGNVTVNDSVIYRNMITIDGLIDPGVDMLGIGGAGIGMNGGNLNITDTEITYNLIDSNAGAIGIGGGIGTRGNLTLTDSLVSYNGRGTYDGVEYDGVANGGGIYALGGTVTIRNSNIRYNRAAEGGAGIYSNGARLNIADSSYIVHNTIDAAGAGYGAGVYVAGGRFDLAHSFVEYNTLNAVGVGAGAGVYATRSTTSISGSYFYGNIMNVSSATSALGGGVYSDTATFTMLNTEVSGNVIEATGEGAITAEGAGVYMLGGTMRSSTVNQNSLSAITTGTGDQLTVAGGGIYAYGMIISTLVAQNYLYAFGTGGATSLPNAGGAGIASAISGGQLTIENATITENMGFSQWDNATNLPFYVSVAGVTSMSLYNDLIMHNSVVINNSLTNVGENRQVVQDGTHLEYLQWLGVEAAVYEQARTIYGLLNPDRSAEELAAWYAEWLTSCVYKDLGVIQTNDPVRTTRFSLWEVRLYEGFAGVGFAGADYNYAGNYCAAAFTGVLAEMQAELDANAADIAALRGDPNRSTDADIDALEADLFNDFVTKWETPTALDTGSISHDISATGFGTGGARAWIYGHNNYTGAQDWCTKVEENMTGAELALYNNSSLWRHRYETSWGVIQTTSDTSRANGYYRYGVDESPFLLGGSFVSGVSNGEFDQDVYHWTLGDYHIDETTTTGTLIINGGDTNYLEGEGQNQTDAWGGNRLSGDLDIGAFEWQADEFDAANITINSLLDYVNPNDGIITMREALGVYTQVSLDKSKKTQEEIDEYILNAQNAGTYFTSIDQEENVLVFLCYFDGYADDGATITFNTDLRGGTFTPNYAWYYAGYTPTYYGGSSDAYRGSLYVTKSVTIDAAAVEAASLDNSYGVTFLAGGGGGSTSAFTLIAEDMDEALSVNFTSMALGSFYEKVAAPRTPLEYDIGYYSHGTGILSYLSGGSTIEIWHSYFKGLSHVSGGTDEFTQIRYCSDGPSYGPAFTHRGDAVITITNTAFVDNRIGSYSVGYGGAMATFDADVTLRGVTFKDNTVSAFCEAYGGALFVQDGNLTIESFEWQDAEGEYHYVHSSFVNNTASANATGDDRDVTSDDPDWLGPRLAMPEGFTNFSNGNTVFSYGGAVCVLSDLNPDMEVVLSGVTFDKNLATATADYNEENLTRVFNATAGGGGIYIGSGIDLKVTAQENKNKSGASLWTAPKTTSFTGNRALANVVYGDETQAAADAEDDIYRTAKAAGGGIGFAGTSAILYGVETISNTVAATSAFGKAESYGGGIQACGGPYLYISNYLYGFKTTTREIESAFDNNSITATGKYGALAYGGGISDIVFYCEGCATDEYGRIYIDNTSVSHNKVSSVSTEGLAESLGGGLYNFGMFTVNSEEKFSRLDEYDGSGNDGTNANGWFRSGRDKFNQQFNVLFNSNTVTADGNQEIYEAGAQDERDAAVASGGGAYFANFSEAAAQAPDNDDYLLKNVQADNNTVTARSTNVDIAEPGNLRATGGGLALLDPFATSFAFDDSSASGNTITAVSTQDRVLDDPDDKTAYQKTFAFGAGIYAGKAFTTVDQSRAARNTGTSKAAEISESLGGGLYNDHDDELSIHRGRFLANTLSATTDAFGGGVYFTGGGDLVFTGSSFAGENSVSAANAFGGGVYTDSDGDLTIDCSEETTLIGEFVLIEAQSDRFYLNRAAGDKNSPVDILGKGGGIYKGEGGGDLTITDSSRVYQNYASNNGGGVWMRSGGEIEISNGTEFYDNVADIYGGGLFSRGNGMVTVRRASFENNFAGRDGGAISNEDGAGITVERSSFIANSADHYGGAIYNINNNVARIDDSNFLRNTAKERGGAVYCNNNHLIVNGSQFHMNMATDPNGYGGALCVLGYTQTEINGSYFAENTAYGGGGAIANYSNAHAGEKFALIVSDTDFVENAALGEDYGYGGAIYNLRSGIQMTGNPETGSAFTGNTATLSGGAIYNERGEIDITNYSFTENEAGEDGGAIYNFNSMGDAISLAGTVSGLALSNNTAGGEGGAIWNNAGALSIANYEITNNEAGKDGGAIYNYSAKELKITSALFQSIAAEEFIQSVIDTVDEVSGYDQFDLNGDGVTDSVDATLFERYVAGARWGTLVDGMDRTGWGRTSVQAVQLYIQSKMDDLTFDADGNGEINDVDTTLFARYIDGKRGTELTSGLDAAAWGLDTEPVILTISGNISGANGGVVWTRGDLTITGSDLIDNIAAGNGGAVYIATPNNAAAQTMIISGNQISENYAGTEVYDVYGNRYFRTSATGGSGGAIYVNTKGDQHTVLDVEQITGNGAYATGNGTLGAGGALWITAGGDSTLNLEAVAELSNNAAQAGDGGAIYAVSKGSQTFTLGSEANEVFTDVQYNVASTGSGGALYLTAAKDQNTTIAGGTMIGNVADFSGGMLYRTSKTGGALNLVGVGVVENDWSVLASNDARDGSGGAIYNDRGSITVTNVQIGDTYLGNWARYDGGAIYSIGSGEVVMTADDGFEGNIIEYNWVSMGNGGFLYDGAAQVSITGYDFVDNWANYDGGAIYSDAGSVTVESTDGLVYANGANNGNGGFLYSGYGKATVIGYDFKGNWAYGSGGVIYSLGEGGVEVTADGGVAFNNNASLNGGFLYAAGGDVTIEGYDFEGNRVGFDGGAIYSIGGDVSVSANTKTDMPHAVASDNIALFGDGGFAYVTGGSLRLHWYDLTDNSAGGDGGAIYHDGGAIYHDGGDLFLNYASAAKSRITDPETKFNVTRNTAGGDGGAIYHTGGKFGTVALNVQDNTAGLSGGAFYLGNTDYADGTKGYTNIWLSDISNNTASVAGGGIYQGAGSTFQLLNVLVSDNTLTGNDGRGAGVYNGAAKGNYYSTTIAGNNAFGEDSQGGGVYVDHGTNTFTNSIIALNEAAEGAQVYNDGGVMKSSYSVSSKELGLKALDPAHSLDYDDPEVPIELFANPNESDYHLLKDSPVAGAGNTNAAVVTVFDLDGEERIKDGAISMGVYENYGEATKAKKQSVYSIDNASGSANAKEVSTGGDFTIDMKHRANTYDTVANKMMMTEVTTLSIRIYYDSSLLTFNVGESTYEKNDAWFNNDLFFVEGADVSNNGGGDQDASTDRYIQVTWNNDVLWGDGKLASSFEILVLNFTTAQVKTETVTNINFGYVYVTYGFIAVPAESVTITITPPTFDVDGNDTFDLNDAEMIIRYFNAETNGTLDDLDLSDLIDNDATRKTTEEVKAYIGANREIFNVNGDVAYKTKAGIFTERLDGEILRRYLAGYEDCDLISGLSFPNGSVRRSYADIQRYIESYDVSLHYEQPEVGPYQVVRGEATTSLNGDPIDVTVSHKLYDKNSLEAYIQSRINDETFDVNGDGLFDSADSELFKRYLEGKTGIDLVDKLGRTSAWTRYKSADIIAYLDANKAAFDINGDNVTDQDDATLFTRYLEGKTGQALVGELDTTDWRRDTLANLSASTLSLRIHYDSSVLTFDATQSEFLVTDGKIKPNAISFIVRKEDADTQDGDSATDSYIWVSWNTTEADFGSTKFEDIFKAHFTFVDENALSETKINFTAVDLTANYRLGGWDETTGTVTDKATMDVKTVDMDFDFNKDYETNIQSDANLWLRLVKNSVIFDEDLIKGITSGEEPGTAAEIRDRLDWEDRNVFEMLDINKDKVIDTNDVKLLVFRLGGFTGENLVSGLVDYETSEYKKSDEAIAGIEAHFEKYQVPLGSASQLFQLFDPASDLSVEGDMALNEVVTVQGKNDFASALTDLFAPEAIPQQAAAQMFGYDERTIALLDQTFVSDEDDWNDPLGLDLFVEETADDAPESAFDTDPLAILLNE